MDKYIYHYTNTNTFIENILPSWSLRASQPKNLKDPKESRLTVESLKHTEGKSSMVRDFVVKIKIVKQYLYLYRVACFSSDRRIGRLEMQGGLLPRMWDQYGDKHSGVCLMIDYKTFIRENKDSIYMIKKVTYKTALNYPRIDGGLLPKKVINNDVQSCISYAEKFIENNIDILFFSKNIDWKGESEIRAIAKSVEANSFYFKIRNSLSGIILGMNFSQYYIPSITELVKGTKIKLLKEAYEDGMPKMLEL